MAQLTIPVFTKMNLDQDLGGPATIIETMSADAGAVLATLVLDQTSLNLCVQSVQALARKLAGIMFAVWRDGTEFDPLLLRPRVAPAAVTS